MDLETGSGQIFPDCTFGVRGGQLQDPHPGRAINPQSVEGQIQGGAVQRLGYGLMEEVVLEDGVNVTTSFAMYLIPTPVDVPDVTPILLEAGEGLGPFGVRVTALPLTAGRVARGLGLIAQ